MTGMSGFGTTGSVVSVGLDGCVGVVCVSVGSVTAGVSGVSGSTGSSGPTTGGRFSIRRGSIWMVIGDPCCAGTFAVVDFSVPVPGLTGMGWDSDEVDSASDAHNCAVGCAPRAGTSGGGEVADCVPVPDELVGVAAVSVPGDREDCASRILGAEMVGVCPMMTAAAQPDTVRKTAAAAAAMIGRRSERHWRFSNRRCSVLS